MKVRLTVQADAQKRELKATLEELEALHRDEARALRRLERDRIDELTDKKLALWERLRAATAQVKPGADERASLERIRQVALRNQILLHHALGAVRGILASASGQELGLPGQRSFTVQDGIRVDFRG